MKSRRGQVLVVAALAIALTILSVQSYLYDLSKQTLIPQNDYLSDYLLSIKQGTNHIATASLINISNGGASINLENNLARWSEFVADDYRFGAPMLNTTLESTSPYNRGLWLEWGTTGVGTSSICFDFNLDISGRDVEVNWDYTVNKTTKVTSSGGYTDLGGTAKQFDLTINIVNEEISCIASSVILHYNKTTTWEDPTSLGDYSVTDYGNGTYVYSFTDDVDKLQVPIRIQIVDLRGVYVRTELILEET